MIETGPALASAASKVDKPPAVVRAEPGGRSPGLRVDSRRLTFGGRRVTDGAVRLPTVMTFVVAMFAATMALVSFGYVATREWRSGTNLLLERRANEALALVRAALSADMKGAWITAIVPFNTTVLDEDPPYSLFQVAARAFARFPYPESFVLWKRTERGGDGITYAFNRADRPPPWNTRPSSDDPFPGGAGPRSGRAGRPRRRRARAGDRRLAVSRARAARSTGRRTRWSRTRCSRPARRTRCSGFMAFTVNMSGGCTRSISIRWWSRWRRSAAAWAASRLRCPTTRAGSVTKAAPVEPDGAGDLHTRFPLLFIDPALVKSIPSRPARVREWTVHVRSLPDRALAGDAAGRAADVLPDFDRGRREPAGARADGARRPGQRRARVDEVGFRRRRHARAEDARGARSASSATRWRTAATPRPRPCRSTPACCRWKRRVSAPRSTTS